VTLKKKQAVLDSLAGIRLLPVEEILPGASVRRAALPPCSSHGWVPRPTERVAECMSVPKKARFRCSQRQGGTVFRESRRSLA